MTVKYCTLFWSFFKVGTFTIGGGYAMIPLMEHELVGRRQWLSSDEFLNQVAVSQSMPGVFAVNMAALSGLRLKGGWGSAIAIAGTIVMPILFIILIAALFRAFSDNIYVERIFKGIRPAVVALIAAPVFNLWRKERTKTTSKLALYAVPLVSALLIWLLGVNPIFIVLAAALIGYLSRKQTPNSPLK